MNAIPENKGKVHNSGGNFEDIAHHLINDATFEYSNPKENLALDSSHHPAIDCLWRDHWMSPGWGESGADKLEAEVWQPIEAVWPGGESMEPERARQGYQ